MLIIHLMGNDSRSFKFCSNTIETGINFIKRSNSSYSRKEIHYKAEDAQVRLGWAIRNHQDGLIFLKDGGTGGFNSLIVIQPKTGRALTMLSNSANIVPCLFTYFKKEECKIRKVHSMSLEKLQRFLGNYENERKDKLSIVLSDNKKFLIADIPKQQPWVLKAESETLFRFTEIDVSLVFSEGVEPNNSFVLKQGGKDYIYKKVEALSN